MSGLPPVEYPAGCLDTSGLSARLRLEWDAPGTRGLADQVLRALEVADRACVAIHAGSPKERLLTRIGEVMLPEYIWDWYLRGSPSSAVAIVTEAPELRGYLESRTRHMLGRIDEQAAIERNVHNLVFLAGSRGHLEDELVALAAFTG